MKSGESQAWCRAGKVLSEAGTPRLLFWRRILFFLLRTVFLKYSVWTLLVKIRVVLKCTPYTMWKYFVPCWLQTESQRNWSSKEKTKTQIKHKKIKCPKMEQLDLLLFGLCFCSLHLRCVPVPGLWRGACLPAWVWRRGLGSVADLQMSHDWGTWVESGGGRTRSGPQRPGKKRRQLWWISGSFTCSSWWTLTKQSLLAYNCVMFSNYLMFFSWGL